MKMELILTGGERIIIHDVCEHDLAMVCRIMKQYHRRWLLKRKQHVIDFGDLGSHAVIRTKDIIAARML